ncbi:hypothetical protein [Trinickia diaoshuihuensis]|uniref:hypothetical protein n=1 Tax=Trinickia diaoshuihuensis TaxID=2292265 RepID=UPI000E2315CB|nr:hypothetical protein [Trinickia diaoshuihuensis]
MKAIGPVLACLAFAGCAATNRVDPDTMLIAAQPLVCRADECTLWWQRAREWVTGHTQYALQTDTSQTIETSGPTGGSGEPAFQVTRARNPDGSSTIGFAAHCDRPAAGCRPDPWNAAADFKQFVRSGVEPAQGRGDTAAQPQQQQ